MIAGDRTFFIGADLIQETGALFAENVRLRGEWGFYAHLFPHAQVRFLEGGETVGTYLAGGSSSGHSHDLGFLKGELSDRLAFGRSLDLTSSERTATERNLTEAAFRLLRRYAKVGSLRDGLSILRYLRYRVALRSTEFYRGVYSVGSAIVHHRLD